MANVYVPNFTRLQLRLTPSVKSVADVQQAMKDTDNEDIYVPGVPSSGLTGGVQEGFCHCSWQRLHRW